MVEVLESYVKHRVKRPRGDDQSNMAAVADVDTIRLEEQAAYR